MKKSKLITFITTACMVILVPLGFYIFKVGLDTFPLPKTTKTVVPETKEDQSEEQADDEKKDGKAEEATEKVPEITATIDPNGPADANEPADASDVAEPNEPLEAINLDNVEMKAIIGKLYDWTGKPVIPTNDDVMKVKITI